MNFSEQLDKFVERGAVDYAEIHHVFKKEMYGNIKADHIAGAKSLKPIVLKLYKTMLNIRDNDLSRIDCRAFAEMTLAEVSHMLEGGGG